MDNTDSLLDLRKRLVILHEKFKFVITDLPNVSLYGQSQYVTMLTKQEVDDLANFMALFLYD